MDYRAHYSTLVNRARFTPPEGYSERHHIVPRCMGGTDAPDNLVRLTAREHLVAHQLLVKMYPDFPNLAFAFRMLSAANHGRRSSRVQGWLREKMAETASANMKRRHKADPSILKRAQSARNKPEVEAKRAASFKVTLERPTMREKWSHAAKVRWLTRDKVAGAATLKANLEGKENGRARAVAQLFPNGFIIREFSNMKAAAIANGLDRHTVYDRVKRGHALWKEI